MIRKLVATLILPLAFCAGPGGAANIIQVGADSVVPTIARAAAIAGDGDTVIIAPGDYYGDVATWTQDRLTVRAGAGGRVRVIAAGSQADGKGIWVVAGGKVTIEDIDFRGARAPGHDGAGLRLEKGHLLLRRCSFYDSEYGVFAADGDAALDIENSEFGDNGDGSGASHTLFAGNIRSLKVSGSYFHHGRGGSLLNSRARDNLLVSNRFTDEVGGLSGAELAFPAGGQVRLIGNIIEQSATTTDPAIIAYGTEGYAAPDNALYLASNTIVDDRPRAASCCRPNPAIARCRPTTTCWSAPAGWKAACSKDGRTVSPASSKAWSSAMASRYAQVLRSKAASSTTSMSTGHRWRCRCAMTTA